MSRNLKVYLSKFNDDQEVYLFTKLNLIIVFFHVILPTLFSLFILSVEIFKIKIINQDPNEIYSFIKFALFIAIIPILVFLRAPRSYFNSSLMYYLYYNIALELFGILYSTLDTPYSPEIPLTAQLIAQMIFASIYFIKNNEYRNSTKKIIRGSDGIAIIAIYVLVGFFAIIALGVLANIINDLIKGKGDNDSINQQSIVFFLKQGNLYVKIVLIIQIVIMAPIFEEIIIRKGFFETCKKRWLGYLLCSYYFAFMHVTNDISSIFQYLFTSLVLSLPLLVLKNSTPGVFLHCVQNAFSLILIFAR